jgi:alcohol dehydrogenase (cytochrome c)
MRGSLKVSLLGAALVGALGSSLAQTPAPVPAQKTVPNFVPVTDAMMKAPKPEDWLMYRGNYQGWGYSALDSVNKANVKNLQLAWSRTMWPGINEITPIVHNGIMYLGNPADVIQAIDATNGELIWEYHLPQPVDTFKTTYGQRKRSIALYGDKIYFMSWDNSIVALDAATGKLVFRMSRGNDITTTNSSGPIVANALRTIRSNVPCRSSTRALAAIHWPFKWRIPSALL